MRILLVIFFCFCLNTSAQAQDSSKPFTEMTIEELQTIDSKTLSKADKKLHKKALSAAKKAEKKRIAAEKKAERARQRAEKKRIAAEKKAERARQRAEEKRLKAEAKRFAEHNKNIQKQLSEYNSTYSSTTYVFDDFEAFTIVTAPAYAENKWFIYSVKDHKTWYMLKAYAYPDENKYYMSLYISKAVHVETINKYDVEFLNERPIHYVTRKGYWPNYFRATMRGGIPIDIEPTEKYLDKCTETICIFRETMAVPLDLELLMPSLEQAKPFEFKVSNAKGESFLIKMPSSYVSGFLQKLAELDTAFSDASKAAKIGFTAIKKQAIVTRR